MLPILRGMLDLAFAAVCVSCGGAIPSAARDRRICARCWARARHLPHPRCERCWMPLPATEFTENASCRLCPELRPALRAIRSAFVLDGPPRELVHALKYKGWYSIADPMGARMAALDWPHEVRHDIGLVVPVPLAPARARQRGYNQAALLARAVAERKGWSCMADPLERGRSAGSQTTLHPGERRANVAGAFRVRTELASSISMQHILVVDDVWTTGATALACGDALLAAGARAFSVLTFARALPELERQQRRAELAGIS